MQGLKHNNTNVIFAVVKEKMQLILKGKPSPEEVTHSAANLLVLFILADHLKPLNYYIILLFFENSGSIVYSKVL